MTARNKICRKPDSAVHLRQPNLRVRGSKRGRRLRVQGWDAADRDFLHVAGRQDRHRGRVLPDGEVRFRLGIGLQPVRVGLRGERRHRLPDVEK